jgi:hypothetical protein
MSVSPSSPSVASASDAANASSRSRIVLASFIGTAIEFYDFYVYATAAALVIGPVFFPHGSAMAQARSARSCSATSAIASVANRRSSRRCSSWGCRRR